MRYILITFLLVTNLAHGADKLDSALEKANLAIPYYGTDFFGNPKAQIFKIRSNTDWLIHQARYGGDGEHTENILIIFELFNHPSESIMKRSPAINKLFQYSISNVNFIFDDGYLERIDGEVVETLCHVCDGWESSSPGDIFKIPVTISVPTLVIRPTLSKSESKKVLDKLEKQSAANIKKQLGYGREPYPDYAEGVVKKIKDLLR